MHLIQSVALQPVHLFQSVASRSENALQKRVDSAFFWKQSQVPVHTEAGIDTKLTHPEPHLFWFCGVEWYYSKRLLHVYEANCTYFI